MNVEVGLKRLELLRELLPLATNIALLVNPTNPIAETSSRDIEAVARTLGLRLDVVEASTDQELDTAFATMVQLRVSGLLIASGDGFFTSRAEHLAALTVRHAVPALSPNREFAVAGGLMSYGGDNRDTYHTAGVYTGRILKGDKPENLAVQQVTKISMVVNLKAAKAVGVTVPLTFLGRADEVIE